MMRNAHARLPLSAKIEWVNINAYLHVVASFAHVYIFFKLSFYRSKFFGSEENDISEFALDLWSGRRGWSADSHVFGDEWLEIF
jgi:hypothetical protein